MHAQHIIHCSHNRRMLWRRWLTHSNQPHQSTVCWISTNKNKIVSFRYSHHPQYYASLLSSFDESIFTVFRHSAWFFFSSPRCCMYMNIILWMWLCVVIATRKIPKEKNNWAFCLDKQFRVSVVAPQRHNKFLSTPMNFLFGEICSSGEEVFCIKTKFVNSFHTYAWKIF